MRSLLFAFLAISCGYLSAQSVSVGQWELRKRNANGTMTSYGVTAENGKAIGFTADVPAMLAVGGSLTIGSSTITSGTSGRALYNNSGVLGELDLASLYAPISHNQAWSTITSTPTTLAGYGITDAITAATAASTYAPLASPTFTGTITTGTGGIVSPNPLFPTRNITISQGTFAWQNVGGSGFGVQLTPTTPTDDRFVSFNPNGEIVSTADTGSVTSTMILDGTIANGDLAGSIALSKLATTGTANSTTYLRGDGAWTAIDLSSYLTTATAASTYLPRAGGTMTGNLTVPIVYPNQTATRPQFALSTATTTGIGIASDRVEAWIAGSPAATFVAGEWQPGASNINWGSNTRLYGNNDATGRLVQRNSTSPQTFSVANTYTSFTSKEEFEIGWVGNSNVCKLRPIKGSGGGTARTAEYHTTEGGVRWTSGSGSPESVVSAPVGSLYTRTDGGASTTLYVKESGTGNTGWIAK